MYPFVMVKRLINTGAADPDKYGFTMLMFSMLAAVMIILWYKGKSSTVEGRPTKPEDMPYEPGDPRWDIKMREPPPVDPDIYESYGYPYKESYDNWLIHGGGVYKPLISDIDRTTRPTGGLGPGPKNLE